LDPRWKLNPKRLIQRAPEHRVQQLLVHNPSLLGHLNERKPRRIVWFWHRSNREGDLWGIDDRGHLVIVEIKRRLGSGEERKAVSQIRAAARRAPNLELDDIEQKYQRLKDQYPLEGRSFVREFKKRTGRTLHLKTDAEPFLYIVAGSYTQRAAKAVIRKSKRRRRAIVFVTMYEVQGFGSAVTPVVVTTERVRSGGW
jgi:hypothetical protein